ncbi:MAG: ABC transporter substrate-binding protein [Clostridium sp.]|nr:ABC transporter substrate-binding protein [Clostridium sp.]
MKKAKKMLALALAAAMAAGGLSACSSGSSSGGKESAGSAASADGLQAAEGGSGSSRDILRVALTSEPPSLSTCDHDSLISVGMNMLTFNGLVRIDNATLMPELDLASEYTVENEVDWIFKLREGVKFHNGDDFTAEDVVASLEYAKSIPASTTYTSNFKSIEAVDPYTVKITTNEPYAGLLYDLGYHFNWILPKGLIESGNDFNENPVGTGPYKLVEWVSGTSLTFVANEEYFDTERAARIKNLEFTIIPEGVSRAIALEAGEVDFVWETNGADAASLFNNADVKVEEVESVDNVILFMNNDIAPFDDVNFRRAIACAINRQDIIDGALSGYGVVNYSSISQGLWGSTNKDQLEYNLDKAKEYLAAWGGDPASVNFPILVTNETRVAVATIIQSNLAELGISVQVESMDTATYFEKWASGDYTGLLASWSPSNALTYVQRYVTDRRNQYKGSYNNPDMDAMILDAQSTLDDDARMEKIEEIVSTVNQDAPQISLFQSVWLRAHDAKLQGVVLSGTGYTSYNEMYWAD